MGVSVKAYVNHGRWVVDCPCGAAEQVERGQASVACRDLHHPGAPTVKVEWPKDFDKIERLLASRGVEHRNWQPGETLTTLAAENRQQGAVQAEVSEDDWRHPVWQGHRHVWPKAKRGDLIFCKECGHPDVYDPREHL